MYPIILQNIPKVHIAEVSPEMSAKKKNLSSVKQITANLYTFATKKIKLTNAQKIKYKRLTTN